MTRMRRNRLRGFTLMEVVVALTLAALVMLGLLGALRSIGHASDRVSTVSDRVADMRLISQFLRGAFAGTQTLPRTAGQADEDASHFRGEPDSVRWVAPLPARHGARGLHVMRLRAVSESGALAVVLDYAPYPGSRATPDWAKARTHFLLGEVEVFQLQYQGSEPDARWEDRWHDESRLPARIKLRLNASGRYWPELIYPLSPL